MWIELTEEKIQSRLSGPELSAAQTAALADGQDSPLADVIAQVTRLVRSHVAACRQNTLGEGQTIPDELEGAAIAIARYYLADRLPVKSLLTEARTKAYDDALQLLRDAAACRVALEQPATASTETTAGPAVQIVSSRTKRATGSQLDGL